MSLKKQFFTTFFILIVQIIGFAQIEVSSGDLPPYDPQTLIEDVLLGEGVEILNIEYDGPDNAVGYFNSAGNDIGLEEGIVLTTGVAATAGANVGIVEAGNLEASANNQSTATDPDIEFLAEGEPIFNLTKYTITFVPSSDMLSFRYVFASEEYPEFGCTDYNDFFGFFISGPGFSGIYENDGENIALIPGTNQTVAINNIHPQNPLNPACTPLLTEFFNDNNGTNNFPVYDGYLDVFTAEATVVPCETYTIKLVIADISDAQRDSGVFFEAKSFNSTGIQVSANSQSLNGTLVEGCTEGSFDIMIAEPSSTDLNVDYQMVGEAVNGVDYETISGTITIPAGQTSVSIPVIPMTDSNIENAESIGLDVQINDCTRDTFYLYLQDEELESPDLGDDVVSCGDASVQLDGTVSAMSQPSASFTSTSSSQLILGPIGGNPPVPAYMDIEVADFYPLELHAGLIESVCININHSVAEDLDVYLYAPGGQFILLTSDNGGTGNNYTNTCFSPDSSNDITFGMQNAPASEAPFTGTFTPEGKWETLWFGDSPVNGTWRLMAIDDEMGFTGQIIDWTINFKPTYEVSYAWSPTPSLSCTDCPNPIASPTETTEYTLTVTDSYGCSTSDNITITLSDEYEAPVVDCINPTTESVTFNWSEVPNAEGYEISLDNGATWIAPNVNATTHTITGLGENETVTIQVRATGPCPANIATHSCQTLNCSGFAISESSTPAGCDTADGTATVTVMGGTADFTYEWNTDPVQTTATATDLAAGEYFVTVVDANNCEQTTSVIVGTPTDITLVSLNVTDVSCFNGFDGMFTVEATGGTPPLEYTFEGTGPQAIGEFGAIEAGDYTVLVTDDAGCSATFPFTVGQPDAIETTPIIIAGPECDDPSATATISINGGNWPFNFAWSNSQMDSILQVSAAGEYYVSVTDANNCEVIDTITITALPTMTLMSSSTDASCGNEDGTATVTVSGNATGFTYLWSDNAAQTTSTATGLAAGEYFVTVTDDNLCTSVTSAVVTTPSSINLISLETTDAACFEDENGTVTASAAGGTPPLMYAIGGGTPQATGDFADLGAGDYNLVITDAMGCSSNFPFTINEPTEITTAPVEIQAIDCQNPNGSATVTVSGGNAPYSFAWSNMQMDSILTETTPGEYSVTVTDNLGCTTTEMVTLTQAAVLTIDTGAMGACSGENTGFVFAEVITGSEPFVYQWDTNAGNAMTDTVFNLAAGMYEVTVTDAGNCEVISSVTVESFPEMALSIETTNADCNGAPDGTATVTVMGGAADFTYLWNDVNGQTTATATALPAGLYSVTVTDSNGCTMTADANVTTPSQLAIDDISATDVTCFDGNNGTTTVTASGGTGDFTYTWDDAATQNTATATGLTANTYAVTVSDEEGCQVTANIEVANAEPIVLEFQTTDVLCAIDEDGSIDLTIVSGGNPTFTYAWDNAATTEDLTDLSAGTYEVTVTDANMCTMVGSASINTTAPILVTETVTDASCFNYEDGAISTTVDGGATPYTYAWSTGDTSENLSEIEAGTYELTVTDANNCGVFSTIEVSQPDPFYATTETTEPLCAEDATGILTVTPVGGIADFSYSLDGTNYTDNPIFSGLTSQSYDLYVQDGNECIFDSTGIFVNAPEVLTVELGEDVRTEIGERAFLEALVAGGTGEIAFSWETPDNIVLSCDDCFEPYALADNAGFVTVIATDENGCIAMDEILVDVNKNYDLFIPNVYSPNNDGVNDLFIPYGKTTTFIQTMKIFDRWGNIVYEGGEFFATSETGWDGKVNGKLAETGVYVYVVEAVFADGENVLFKGDVTVLR